MKHIETGEDTSKKEQATKEQAAIKDIDPKKDDNYLDIWKIEQAHSRTRWTVTTFFLSVSFAILGTSFNVSSGSLSTLILGLELSDFQRVTGLLIYWFGYILFMQFNRYTNFLRSQMREMEKDESVSFNIQSKADKYMYSKTKAKFSAKWLLFYFGLVYTAIVILMAI